MGRAGRVAPASLADRRRAGLARFIAFEQVTCATAVAVILAVHTWLHPSPYLVVLAVIIAVAAGAFELARRSLAAGAVGRAVTWVAAIIWGLSISSPAIATFCLPVMTVAALLPTALAVPYVDSRTLWRINVVSMCVSMAAVLVGTVQDFSGLTPALPSWIPPAVLLVFVPFSTGLHVMVSTHNSSLLSDALVDALDANQRLRCSEADLRRSRSRLVAVADEERRRIARDLHDGAQQRLLTMAVDVRRARRLVSSDPAAAAACLDRLAVELEGAMAEMRDFAHGVYPAELRDFGLQRAVAELAARAPFHCSVDFASRRPCSPEVEASVYWCCVEALHNVAKHAGTGVRARLCVGPAGEDGLAFAVEDDGVGFDPSTAMPGRGLTNMGDRIGAVGGTLTVLSGPGRGTRVAGVVPTGQRPGPVQASSIRQRERAGAAPATSRPPSTRLQVDARPAGDGSRRPA